METGKEFLEVGHGPDKSGGGTELVRYLSLENVKPALESGGFTGQVR
jgi:hypothetical protein